jgi:hypothetical protein
MLDYESRIILRKISHAIDKCYITISYELDEGRDQLRHSLSRTDYMMLNRAVQEKY